jgi:BirA family biotin operon repressor/biotin-[acetyl-CoA-carboxylase] ligase
VKTDDLLAVLADGRVHSGEEIARAFGVTRAAIWKHIAKLADWGLAVDAAPGAGYRLSRPLELLSTDGLRAALEPKVAARVARLEVFTELGSTNQRLLRTAPAPGRLDVCVAEFQSAGRGRRGRRWHAPLGSGICLSVGWQFVDTPAELSALSLAVGVVTRRALKETSGLDVSLKWPNDLVWDERKLGGILVELSTEAQGGSHVVVGIGVNVAVPHQLLSELSDWPRGAVDLLTALGHVPPRVAVVGALVNGLAELFDDYGRSGFAAYRSEWRAVDYLRGRNVRLDDAAGSVNGTAVGIDADGALLIETAPGTRRRVVAGDVSVRSGT